jgi:hypothetical protein
MRLAYTGLLVELEQKFYYVGTGVGYTDIGAIMAHSMQEQHFTTAL